MANGVIERVVAAEGEHLIASTAFAVCETVAGTAAKKAYIKDSSGNNASFTLYDGVTVHVAMQNANTAGSPTLSINGTTALAMSRSYTATDASGSFSNNYTWPAGSIITVTLRGTRWVVSGEAKDRAQVNNIFSQLTSINSAVSSHSTDISNLKTKVGTATLDTTAKNLCEAVNELKGKVDTNTNSIKNKMDKSNGSVSGILTLNSGAKIQGTSSNNLSGAPVTVSNNEIATPMVTFDSGKTYIGLDNSGSTYTDLRIMHPSFIVIGTGQTVNIKDHLNRDFMPIHASAFALDSSLRYKENIEDAPDSISDMVNSLNVKKYDYKEHRVTEDKRYNRVGLIAEELAQVIPTSVEFITDENGNRLPDGIDYSSLVPYLLKTIQVQEKKIKALSARLDAVEAKINN